MLCLCMTGRCNIRCAHCACSCAPEKGELLPLEMCKTIAQRAHCLGFGYIQITGGEPFVYERQLLELAQYASGIGLTVFVGTNGFWGEDIRNCGRLVAALRKAGCSRLQLSFDGFHEEFVPLSAIVNIGMAAERAGIDVQVSPVTIANDQIEVRLKDAFRNTRVGIVSQPLSPYGRAADLEPALFPDRSGDMDHSCALSFVTTIYPDGRVFACCGPALSASAANPLWLGSVYEDSLDSITRRVEGDALLSAIRILGGCRSGAVLLPEASPPPTALPVETRCTRCLAFWNDPARRQKARMVLQERPDIQQNIVMRRMVLRQRLTALVGRQASSASRSGAQEADFVLGLL